MAGQHRGARIWALVHRPARVSYRTSVGSAAFQDLVGRVEALWAPDAHPFTIISAIYKSREVILLHALVGKISSLTGVPLVQRITTELRPHEGRDYPQVQVDLRPVWSPDGS